MHHQDDMHHYIPGYGREPTGRRVMLLCGLFLFLLPAIVVVPELRWHLAGIEVPAKVIAINEQRVIDPVDQQPIISYAPLVSWQIGNNPHQGEVMMAEPLPEVGSELVLWYIAPDEERVRVAIDLSPMMVVLIAMMGVGFLLVLGGLRNYQR